MTGEAEDKPIQIVTIETTTEKARTFNDPKAHGWTVRVAGPYEVIGYSVTHDEGHGMEEIFFPKEQVVSVATRQVPR